MQQLRRLGDIRRDPPRLVARERRCCRYCGVRRDAPRRVFAEQLCSAVKVRDLWAWWAVAALSEHQSYRNRGPDERQSDNVRPNDAPLGGKKGKRHCNCGHRYDYKCVKQELQRELHCSVTFRLIPSLQARLTTAAGSGVAKPSGKITTKQSHRAFLRNATTLSSLRCPLYPRKRTWLSVTRMSAKCQKRKFHVQSTTLSALTSMDGGSLRPRDAAVLRLTINSNFTGCSTGRSAGFVPRSILST